MYQVINKIKQINKRIECKCLMIGLLNLFLAIFIITLSAQADDGLNQPDRAKKIAGEMVDRDDGQTRYSRVELITCRYNLKSRKRKCSSRPVKKSIESISIDVGDNLENTISLGIINDPPSEKNMAFLQKDYDEEGKYSDQWMYFPALKKQKRIVSQSENSPKTGSIFGTEISYEDIEKIHLSNYTYSYEGLEQVDNRICDKIIAYPTDKRAPKTSYCKEIFWIDQQTKIPLKREMYDKRGKLIKTFFCKEIIEINGVWLNKIRIVVNHETRRMTMEKILKMAVNITIKPELVSFRALKDVSYREMKMNKIREQAK